MEGVLDKGGCVIATYRILLVSLLTSVIITVMLCLMASSVYQSSWVAVTLRNFQSLRKSDILLPFNQHWTSRTGSAAGIPVRVHSYLVQVLVRTRLAHFVLFEE